MPNTVNTASPIDWEDGLRRVAGNRALLEKLLHRIAGDLPHEFAKIEECIANGDMEALGALAHTLKGTSGNLSITAIYEQSIALEGAAKAGDTAEISALLQKLKDSAKNLTDYLQSL